jgi:hypothetical protein
MTENEARDEKCSHRFGVGLIGICVQECAPLDRGRAVSSVESLHDHESNSFVILPFTEKPEKFAHKRGDCPSIVTRTW